MTNRSSISPGLLHRQMHTTSLVYDGIVGALVKANAMGADAVVDLTVDANLDAVGAKNNATYFQAGGVHPTQAGCALIAGHALPVFQSLG